MSNPFPAPSSAQVFIPRCLEHLKQLQFEFWNNKKEEERKQQKKNIPAAKKAVLWHQRCDDTKTTTVFDFILFIYNKDTRGTFVKMKGI